MRPALKISLLAVSGKLIQVKRHTVVGNTANVPEDFVADWSLRFPHSAMATGTPRKPRSVWTILLCIAVCRYVCSGEHLL